jgi:hypothetical protein
MLVKSTVTRRKPALVAASVSGFFFQVLYCSPQLGTSGQLSIRLEVQRRGSGLCLETFRAEGERSCFQINYTSVSDWNESIGEYEPIILHKKVSSINSQHGQLSFRWDKACINTSHSTQSTDRNPFKLLRSSLQIRS